MGEWISVNDRLPDDELLNVVRYGWRETGKHIGIQLSHFYKPSNMDKKVWDFEFASSQPTKVTHWMPLPEHPKDE